MYVALRSLSFFLVVLSSFGLSEVLAQADLSKKLQQELNTTRQEIPVYVMLKAQANAKDILATESARGLSKNANVAYALTAVKERNQQAQQPFLQRLDGFEAVSNVRSRWIVNLVGFSASPAAIRAIATYPEVAAIYYDEPWEVEQVLEEAPALFVPNGKEPGLRAINADKMWSLGYTGFGGVAFTADTGVDPFHPALNHKYAGYDGRTGSWYDFNQRIEFPYDCDDHGTHVTGTILGVDRTEKDTIGVAYNAHWIGGAILCGIGTADNIGAFEWAIDPDGDFETNDDRPVVINNSWRDPSIADDECTSANPYPTILDNLEAAGIAVVFSAGNSGPDASTITPPHNYNSGLVNAFTIGALNTSSTGIAEFSSRGPALCTKDSMPLDIKPEVSAPGQSVRSCLPDGGYGFKSGTSMAAPHVAGAILLLNEAFPDLGGEALKLALYFSARDLGVTGEDNTFGRGIIDVFAAYNYLIAEGNTPTAPSWPATAPVVHGMTSAGTFCNGEFGLSVTLRNEGIVEITEVTFEYTIDDVLATDTRDSLSLMPGETLVLDIVGTTSAEGNSLAQFRLLTANGAAVDPRLDIGGTLKIQLSQGVPASLIIDDFGAEGPCLNSPIVLSLAGTTGDSIFSYFNTSPTFGVGAIDMVQPFVIEELTERTNLYAVAEYLISDGVQTPLISEVNFISTDDVTMEIVANANARLRKANVISAGTGRVLVQTMDLASGVLIGRRSTRLVEGINEVGIVANLEEGERYSITISGNTDLGYLPNERVRGTEIGGGRIDIVSATGSFFLFDIEVGYTDGCPPIELELIPDSTRTSRTLAPMAIPAQVELGSTVTFSETSVANATNHRWIVEGTTYSGSGDMLSLTPTALGTISARVLAKDENDCWATGTTEAEVIASSSNTEDVDEARSLEVFPNPAANYFKIEGEIRDLKTVSLIDASGRLLQEWIGTSQRYELLGVPSGTYLLKLVDIDGKSQVVPLIVE